MSHFLFNSDPDEDGYNIVRLNNYVGITPGSQVAVGDQGAARNEMAGFATDWYGTLVNAPNNFQLVQSFSGYQDTDFTVGASYDTNAFGPLPSSTSYPSTSHNAIDYITTLPISVQAVVPTPTIVSASTSASTSIQAPILFPDGLEGHPSVPEDLVVRLRGAGAVSLASLAMDTANLLWIYMSMNSLGRTPADNLCHEIYIKAIQRRQRAQATWVPEEGKRPHKIMSYCSLSFGIRSKSRYCCR